MDMIIHGGAPLEATYGHVIKPSLDSSTYFNVQPRLHHCAYNIGMHPLRSNVVVCKFIACDLIPSQEYYRRMMMKSTICDYKVNNANNFLTAEVTDIVLSSQ
jgi:hypothetical protein